MYYIPEDMENDKGIVFELISYHGEKCFYWMKKFSDDKDFVLRVAKNVPLFAEWYIDNIGITDVGFYQELLLIGCQDE